MRIAVLGAMEIEIKPLLKYFDEYEVVEYANNKYYLAEYKGHDLVIAHSKIGKVFSALTATVMIEKFNAEVLLFTGVAGGLGDLEIGDVIAATATVQHDVDITAFGYPYGKIPGADVTIHTSKDLLAKAQEIAQERDINFHTGIIATGDQFIHSAERKTFITKEFGAKALEMEGGSVNQVCNEFGVPCLILRSISDTADGTAPENFDIFAKEAADKSANFVMSMIKKF
ncbi:5'-methylthioadenosine/adenosylhomocysteine nucleosidase [Francisella frigiditurris]|uniref:adenosylhomocysteine nucleosidase n=1 Tax=Francisella frigiditurris TaxID=1542390 RepID=A0A1J0KUR2_9GAMM|nr:5'-methylthioadenosine/adenosylhomocysteine nucleosidase [Francisella frigiditurris]APC97415.1 MTA/SAH nucleosidase [Francisella frigiditurris]